MEPSQKEGRAFPISVAVVFLSLMGFALVQERPFTSERPTAGPEAMEATFEGTRVPARLWQDPFAAVARHRRKEAARSDEQSGPSAPLPRSHLGQASRPQTYTAPATESPSPGSDEPHHTLGRLNAQFSEHLDSSEGITVLAAMLFGGPYEEQAELRRRWRYAVVSALAESGYIPQRSDSIQYILPGAIFPAPVPYEWFLPGPGARKNQSVLILWLEDETVGAAERPLDRLMSLLSAVRPGTGGTGAADRRIEYKVLGPAGTTTLSAMSAEIRELLPGRSAPGKPDGNGAVSPVERRGFASHYKERLALLGGLTFVSATATADDCLILGETPGCDLTLAGLFSRLGRSETGQLLLSLSRTIPRDSALARTLARELELRGALPQFDSSHIVLISEWDTQYGRSLPEVMAAQFTATSPEVTITRFNYLRGLDGQLPDSEQTPENNSNTAEESTQFEKERASGRARYDYLRRLVASVERLNQRSPNHRRVRAIGILGSDLYDKQLILQALRPVLTDVHFFTTDLDARLLHPSDYRWNRNLLIASGYGLELTRDYQNSTAPFRSGYQTSVYLAALLALEQGVQIPDCLRPRLFEVGRNGAFDLTPPEAAPLCPDSSAPALHPTPPPFFPSTRTWVEIAFFVLAGLYFTYYTSSAVKGTVHGLAKRTSSPWRAALIFVGVAALVLYLIVYFVGGALRYEPFTLTDGLSAWPSTVLRLAAIGLSLLFIPLAIKSLSDSSDAIGARLHRGAPRHRRSPEDAGEESKQAHETIPSLLWEKALIYPWRRSEHATSVSGEKIWEEYEVRGRSAWRFLRLFVPFAIYSALIIWILFTANYHVPVRGDWAAVYTLWISIISFLLMSLLTFFVVDASRLCRRFVQLISRPGVAWTTQTKENFKDTEDESLPLDEWVSLRIVSERANRVARLIVYPFTILLLIIISRLSYFDNWDTPLAIILIYLGLAAYTFVSVFILHRAAEQARRSAIDALEDKMITAYHNQTQADEYRVVIERIRELREGAFRPLAEQPVVKTLLLPFGGGAGLLLLDYLDWLR